MVTNIFRKYIAQIAVMLFISVFSAPIIAETSSKNVVFQNPLEGKDVNTGEVGAIIQDHSGFMWIGGGANLLKYDGSNVTVIDEKQYVGKKVVTSRAIKFTRAIMESKDNNIWISTRNGILKYDTRLEKITRVEDNAVGLKISNADIMNSIELPTGEILGCSVNGLFVVDPKTMTYTTIMPDASKDNWLNGSRTVDAHIDGAGAIWIGSDKGLEKVDWATKKFTLYPMSDDPRDLLGNKVTSIASNGASILWIGTTKGVVRFDTETGIKTRFSNNKEDKNSLSGDDVWKVVIDRNGEVWIGSDGGGVSIYTGEFKNNKPIFYNYKYKKGLVGAISSDKVRTIFEDAAGDIWVGNYPSGINFYDRSSTAVKTIAQIPGEPDSLGDSNVVSIVEEKTTKNFWVGTDSAGLDYFNRNNNTVKHYLSDDNDPSSISGKSVTSLFIDSTGTLWYGTWMRGMGRYDSKTDKFVRLPFVKERDPVINSPPKSYTALYEATDSSVSFYDMIGLLSKKPKFSFYPYIDPIYRNATVSNVLNGGSVWTIVEDRNGDLWVSTHYGGISRYDVKRGLFINYQHIPSDATSIANNTAWNILIDSKDRLWVGTTAGLDLFHRDTGVFEHFVPDKSNPESISNISVINITEDTQGRLWVGTDAGLNLFDPETKKFKQFRKSEGLVNDETIRKVIEGDDGTIWGSTLNGFFSLDPKTYKIKTYNRVAGTLMGGFSKTGILSSNGEIIFGSTNGLRVFKPSDVVENKITPKVAFTGFKIFSDEVTIGDDYNVLKESLNNTKSITLDYSKSMFTLEFSALSFRDSGKNSYYYKLDGFDSDWVNSGTVRFAKYTNLSSGKYDFKVKGCNNDGYCSDQETQIKIIQLPPPWKTWWAYSIYYVIGMLIIYLFIRNQARKKELLIEQNRVLELTVTERTAEVVEKSKNIKSMMSNLPQGLFTMKQDGLIHGEYSAYMETIFETTDIVNRDVLHLLFNNATIGEDKADSALVALGAILGEDEMMFDYNSHLLPSEIEYEFNENKKYLSVEWYPLVSDDGIVSKMMVSVKDVTVIREVEAKAHGNQRQLDIVGQLLKIPADKFDSFEATALDYIEQNRALVSVSESNDIETIDTLFRNMHTIKGNCRTYGFTYMSDVVHLVESEYSDYRIYPEKPWYPKPLLADLDKVTVAINEYGDIYRNVLGRSVKSGGRKPGFWMDNKSMEALKMLIDTGNITDIDKYVECINSKDLVKCLEDVIDSLPSIAAQLGKKNPIVFVEESEVMIKSDYQGMLNDVFAHILRNSVDHGLESTDERSVKGKSIHGNITIGTQVVDNAVKISVKDDGKGLNIVGLYNKGLSLGRWSAGENPAAIDIANLIFDSGVSTNTTVSDISGRGVGMDAVRHYVMDNGGMVEIKLDSESVIGKDYIPFSLIITLPDKVFYLETRQSV